MSNIFLKEKKYVGNNQFFTIYILSLIQMERVENDGSKSQLNSTLSKSNGNVTLPFVSFGFQNTYQNAFEIFEIPASFCMSSPRGRKHLAFHQSKSLTICQSTKSRPQSFKRSGSPEVDEMRQSNQNETRRTALEETDGYE